MRVLLLPAVNIFPIVVTLVSIIVALLPIIVTIQGSMSAVEYSPSQNFIDVGVGGGLPPHGTAYF